jgi:hypothetical protein
MPLVFIAQRRMDKKLYRNDTTDPEFVEPSFEIDLCQMVGVGSVVPARIVNLRHG